MKKLVLNVDELQVQSFETLRAQQPSGTVVGAQEGTLETCESGCYCETQEATCDYTCDFTCGYSCWDTDCGCYTDAGMYTCDWRCEQTFVYSPC